MRHRPQVLLGAWAGALLCVVALLPGRVLVAPAHAQGVAPSPPGRPAPTPGPAQDDDMERVETDLVSVLFNAMDKRHSFITTLKRADLHVFEDNAAQQIANFERETDLPLALALLIDVSSSQDETLPAEQAAAHTFVQSIIRPGKDTAAIISFTGAATVEQDLTSDRALLDRAIDRMKIEPPSDKDERFEYDEAEKAEVVPARVELVGLSGSTALWDAIWATSAEVLAQTSPQARRAIILLTDGDDTSSRVRREDAATAAIKANTFVYAIGIEPICEDCSLDKKALRKISEQTGGRAFFPKDQQELDAAFAQIQQELRTQYLVAYTPTNKAHDGSYRGIRLELISSELKKQGVRLTYREGYFARQPGAPQPAARRTNGASKRLARPPRRPRKP